MQHNNHWIGLLDYWVVVPDDSLCEKLFINRTAGIQPSEQWREHWRHSQLLCNQGQNRAPLLIINDQSAALIDRLVWRRVPHKPEYDATGGL